MLVRWDDYCILSLQHMGDFRWKLISYTIFSQEWYFWDMHRERGIMGRSMAEGKHANE